MDASSRAPNSLRATLFSKSGFGILDEKGNYLKFDNKGNQQALKLLESTGKQDHLRVDVSGTADGSVIHVRSLKLL
ncbi:MAG TPA: hypothetical protein VHZ28_05825 [Terracidiphilus sp.]|nr:hypothetical protein [Terracidiphilus sp.]